MAPRDFHMSLTVLIPAYNPSAELARLVGELLAQAGVGRVLVVDDGSDAAGAPGLEAIAQRERVELLHHDANLGKGAALRTGVTHFLRTAAADELLVTADADGQHRPADILAVARAGAASPGSLVLGSRSFTGEVPRRSRLGNGLTRVVFRLLIGQDIADTQTGLRAIPRVMLPQLLHIRANGYDFELEMLILGARLRVPITSVPIQTVYLDGNASSHFHPIRDSARVYFVFIRFVSSAALTAVIDNLAFALVFQASQRLAASMVVGRLVACAFNFAVNRQLVFRSRDLLWRVLTKYVALVLVLGWIAYGLIHLLVGRLGWNPYAAKLTVEGGLLLASFLLQRGVVFPLPPPPETGRATASGRRA
jgi:glycosyltransferase involved in cell wall biosynthesis